MFRLYIYVVLRFAMRSLRVATYVGVLAVVVLFFVARSVRAQLGERSLALGHELAQFRDVLHGVHRVTLNGETLYVASAVSEQTMGQVLDRFEASCRERSGGLAEQYDNLPSPVQARLKAEAPAAWEMRLGIIREVRADEGSILCIERREGHGLKDAIGRYKAFARSGDLYDLGNLRYVHVRPTDNGKVHVLSTLTEGRFNLYNVVGKGIAEPAGIDPPEAPRPPGSKRVMSAQLEGMYGAYMFASPQQTPEILAFYDGDLPARGWLRITGNTTIDTEVWQRDGVTMVLQAHRRDDDDQTVVTLSQGRTIAAAEVAQR
jgi:hypothetical protein